MAPVSSKGKGKGQTRDARRSRSRNTTPVSLSSASMAPELATSSYLHTSLSPALTLSDTAVEDILNGGGNSSNPPSASALNAIAESVKTLLLHVAQSRGETCEKLIRELADKKKERADRNRQRGAERDRQRDAEREAEERRRRMNKVTPKKRDREEERPLAVGAHGLARQDGVDAHKAETSSSISSPTSQPPPSLPELNTKVAKDEAASPSSSASPHQPPPAPPVQQYQVFGEDPTAYPDPTIYHIRDLTPDMTEEQRKEILCVADYPHDDLHDLTCGTPPDRDFSNARPANQIAASTFANFVEPYIRALTEEDRAFLLERGDREKPFIMPKRGARPYKDIWAEEDGGMVLDSDDNVTNNNEARGDIDLMDDKMAESEALSTGPVLARLLTLMRNQSNSNDEAMTNGVASTEMDIDGESTENRASEAQPPPTQLPDWKNQPLVQKASFDELDERILQELRYIGFLSPSENPDYHAQLDDEVAARLRYLQAELRRQSMVNGARKARLLELTEERMAAQEWQGIADDLDNQLNQAYLKRNRNISKKGGKVKRPAAGGPHAAGVARPAGAAAGAAAATAAAAAASSVGEPIRQLMERRERWHQWVGAVVNYGKTSIPKQTVFDKDSIERLIAKEQESWGEVEDI